MSRIILLILLSILSYSTFAQLKVSSLSAPKGSSRDLYIRSEATLQNTTNKPLKVFWQKTEAELTPNWQYTFCEQKTHCQQESLTTGYFTLAPNETRTVSVRFAPNNMAGNGTVIIEFSAANTPDENIQPQLFTATAVGNSTPTNNPSAIYPNPVISSFQISDSLPAKSIAIYNIVGKQVAEYPVQYSGQLFNVNYLPKGVYLIRIQDNQGLTLQTVRITKHNP